MLGEECLFAHVFLPMILQAVMAKEDERAKDLAAEGCVTFHPQPSCIADSGRMVKTEK